MSEDTNKNRLSAKQKLFIKEYLVDFNASGAARRAGYSEKSAKEIGYENLTKPHIKAQIDFEMAKVIKNTDKIVFENLEFWDEVKKDEEEKLEHRLKASEYLGKFAAMFTDKIEQTGPPVIVKLEKDDGKLL